MWRAFLYLSNFGFCLYSVSDFSKTAVSAPTSVECTSCLCERRTIRFGYMFWIRIIVTFCWLFFPYQLMPFLLKSSSHYLTELSGCWPMRFFHPAFVDVHRWPNFGFIYLTSQPPCCFPWRPATYVCILLFFLFVLFVFCFSFSREK